MRVADTSCSWTTPGARSKSARLARNIGPAGQNKSHRNETMTLTRRHHGETIRSYVDQQTGKRSRAPAQGSEVDVVAISFHDRFGQLQCAKTIETLIGHAYRASDQ
jgi:hypothetical protein